MKSGKLLIFTISLFHFMLCVSACKNRVSNEGNPTEKPVESIKSNAEKSTTGIIDARQTKNDQDNVTKFGGEESNDINKVDDDDSPKPKGFVIKNNTVMYEQDNSRSKALATLKKGEFVFLIETSLNDENGQMSSYPTWYKIQSVDKKTGWVESSRVSFGH